jgi:hypothetical protein
MTRMQTILIMTALCVGSFGASACNRTPEDAHSDAVETQKEAARDISANNQAAQKTIDEAQREAAKTAATETQKANQAVVGADKKIAEAQQEARHDNAEVQAKANEKIRAANIDVMGDKAEVRVWGQKLIDSLNAKIDDARVKAQKATAKTQAAFEVGMKDVQSKRDTLTTELASIQSQAADKVTAFKARLEAEVDRLKTRVTKLEGSLAMTSATDGRRSER